ncbi:flagellar filament capping protein FliD [Vibrio maerlii]|uniref:flagellar filament capping protein FliD n=1 Tax=Vibrio maerlii TaxID=2231648 RepID=UPI000E3BA410|nr:flagellar filament capping protein FliD [Vibrio maerlii]
MSINPMGMGAGMDINSMVSKIVNAERLPKQQRIDNERTQIDTSISAYGRLRESLDSMKMLMAEFRQEKAFAARTVDSTDESVISATATTEAIAGKYAVDVLQLAQSHKIASDVLPKDVKFDQGKLQISLGDDSFSIDVKKNARLVDVVREINSAKDNPGVRASVINDVEGPRMILASDYSGAEHNIQISVDAEIGNPLKQFEYKTLEDRIEALEKARANAQALIAPESVSEDEEGQDVAALSEDASDEESLDQPFSADPNAAEANMAEDLNGDGVISADEMRAAVAAATGKPEDTIPGWSETASGTLLDSYQFPEPELDQKALKKAPDVPGWSNTASGTLTDSYVTPKEAQAALDSELAAEQAAIASAVANGDMTEEEAKAIERAKLPKEEQERLEQLEVAQKALVAAQSSFDAYNGMTEVQAAQDSMVMLDGVAQLSSDNNVIENAIDGVDLTVKNLSKPGEKPAEIGIEYDRQRVQNDIEQFVAAYNQFYQTTKDLSAVDPVTGQMGPLAGDSIVRNAESRLKSVFSTSIEKAPEDIKSLTEFGITTTRQGNLEINYEMLNKQINNNFNKLGEFFGGNDGFAKKVEDAIHSLTGMTGTIRTREQGMVERNYRLNDDQDSLDRRMQSLEQRTHAKFTAMQDATSNMQSQLAGLMSAIG